MKETDSQQPEFGQEALRHLDALYGFAMILTHNQSEAEDLVQETYLRAVRAFGRLAPDSNLKGWLFTIMRNLWFNRVRHLTNHPRTVEIDTEAEELSTLSNGRDDDPFTILLRKVEREQVHAAIGQLPPHHREIIVLRDLEGFSYQQIANILGCPAGTVMSRLARARGRLREILLHFPVGAWRDPHHP